MKIRDQPIIIVGAGPVGLYAAVCLVAAGRQVVVLEKNRDLARDMRASTFHPATLDLLDRQQLAEPLAASGSIRQGWQYMIHGTKSHAVFDLEEIRDSTAHPYRLLCEQYYFTGLALELLAQSPLFEIRFQTEVTGLEQRDGGLALDVRHPDGTDQLSTSWLIAADGAHSRIRGHLGLPFSGSEFERGSITLVLDHPFQEDVPGLLGINYVWTEADFYSLMQIRDLWRFVYSPERGQDLDQALSDEAVQSHLQSVFPGTRPYRVLQRSAWSLQQRCLDSFRAGPVVFVGDAAHVESPSGGMGMNAGIHDAHCLVEHLLPVLDGEDDRLLDRYSRRRRTVTQEEVQRLSSRNHFWHRESGPDQRQQIWSELQDIVNDPSRARDFLLDVSMIRSRRRELEID
jgi:3-(3-hydroxy-phenyl)propionate hydroxylase